MSSKPQTCPDCGRPVSECYVDVDREEWPQAAVEAFDLAGYETAATCLRGQARDIRRTTHGKRGGWCADRVARHPEYRGKGIRGLQKDVQGAARRRLG